jgi:hypothetical protein
VLPLTSDFATFPPKAPPPCWPAVLPVTVQSTRKAFHAPPPLPIASLFEIVQPIAPMPRPFRPPPFDGLELNVTTHS